MELTCKCGKPVAFDGLCYSCIIERNKTPVHKENLVTKEQLAKLARSVRHVREPGNARNKSLALKQMHLKRLYLIDRLGRMCVDCKKAKEPLLMRFDATVTIDGFTLDTLIAKHYSVKRLANELNKYELRCIECYTLKHEGTAEYHWAVGRYASS